MLLVKSALSAQLEQKSVLYIYISPFAIYQMLTVGKLRGYSKAQYKIC